MSIEVTDGQRHPDATAFRWDVITELIRQAAREGRTYRFRVIGGPNIYVNGRTTPADIDTALALAARMRAAVTNRDKAAKEEGARAAKRARLAPPEGVGHNAPWDIGGSGDSLEGPRDEDGIDRADGEAES